MIVRGDGAARPLRAIMIVSRGAAEGPGVAAPLIGNAYSQAIARPPWFDGSDAGITRPMERPPPAPVLSRAPRGPPGRRGAPVKGVSAGGGNLLPNSTDSTTRACLIPEERTS
ncbi:hypothetical protein Arub01_48890 [Actinomadura rubrobrunea]|uniref:Uncharacterized protein n=1 Tax=Actinomadura rubrobrunea TaxID=115335 RepID=A0A9W6PYV0_9ACTN|nr:hypothetical protein Arub01_48890 [Actinomadura rubrobrunea]